PALMTGVGVLLGTAAYMSPEQAKGREADKRSDIWAFGAVLYEMLTGRRAFDGEDMTDVLGAVVRLDPNWEAVPPMVPQPIRTLIQRCLVKDRRARVADIAAVRFVLDHQTGPLAAGPAQLALPPAPARSLVRRLAIPATVLVTGAATAAAMVFFLQRPTPRPVARFTLSASGNAAVAVDANDRVVAVAPDGLKVAYTGASSSIYGTGIEARLFVRALDQLEPTLLAGPGDVREPFFSPDGAWVGFFGPASTQQLQKVSATGGPPIPLTMVDGPSRGATWGPDDAIIFATNSATTGLQRISGNGGEATVLTRPNSEKGERDHFWPHVLPGRNAVLFTIVPSGAIEDAQIAVLDLRDGSQKIVLRGGSDGRYVEGGYLVYGVAGTLRAVAFDLDRLEVRGSPVPVLQQVVTTASVGAANFAVGTNGTLAYVSGAELGGAARTLVWVNRDGREEPLKVPPRAYVSARLSPDGTRVALDVRDEQNDIWIWDLQRQILTRLTFDPGPDVWPVWTPDGRRIVYSSARDGTPRPVWQAADGTGTAEPLTNDAVARLPSSFSPDGTRLLFQHAQVPQDVGMVTIGAARRTELLLQGTYNEQNPEVSPDGRWLAYQSDESGRTEIYVRPFPNVDGGKWQVSAAGGTRPLWSRDGRELFYWTGTRGVMAVPVQAGTTFAAGRAAVVVGPAFLAPNAGRNYDVSPDGRRFLMIKQATGEGAAAPVQLVVVQNWLEELKRLVPAN
ncbi:MAG: PD40 domain-containing protein, partial [Acidobacteria bacterium]|nr:PD40 domain-containing protein [Acidobacteriota bacterium]